MLNCNRLFWTWYCCTFIGITIPELVGEQKANQHLQISDEQNHGMHIYTVYMHAITVTIYICI